MYDSAKQVKRVDRDHGRETLNATQGKVPLPALDTAHVGTVHPDELGEGLLRQATSLAMGAEVAPESSLKFAFHDDDERRPPLLPGLHTYK